MLFLALAILLNLYVSLSLKVFERLRIDTLQAIVVNYCVCVVTGSIFMGHFPLSVASVNEPWFGWAVLMGFSFISIFNLMAYCTRTEGVTTTTIANKLSLVIPVGFALWLYGESMSWTKAIGILLAIPAVYLSTNRSAKQVVGRLYFLPLVLFLFSGLLDTLVNYVATRFFSTGNPAGDAANQSAYLVHSFGVAALVGLMVAGISIVLGKRTFSWRNVVAGIVLGVPNYFSIYFLIRLLQSGYLPGSVAIPATNIGVVLFATIAGFLFFGEKASRNRLAGILLSLIAIILILSSAIHGNLT